jgi:hypothetical protein
VSITLVIAALVIAAIGHRVWVARRYAAAAELRAAADEALWRRYNTVGDLIPWAANEGAEETQALFRAVIAARTEIMAAKNTGAARLAAEDRLQAALNGFYCAAYADDELLGVHEFVVVAAHLLIADRHAESAALAYDRAVAGLPKLPPPLATLYRLTPSAALGLRVAPQHPKAEERPLA